MELKLDEHEMKVLDEVSALPPEYPGWMFPIQSAGRLGPLEVSAWQEMRLAASKA